MVMETPSPQCVGREFVRQYYTLLHEAPLHLHRFYSHNSSFVHGGVEKPGEEQPPIMGQGEIHKKIMSLNFRDCHAKIRQVDSQATVGSAVVVQVTGELSNNGQPMRRFMQTFVLAPQSPKKYYVHNDIFRYQDEVFHDDDPEGEQQEQEVESSQMLNFEEIGVDSEPEVDQSQMQSQPEAVQDPTVTSYFEPQQPQLSNGTGHLEERPETPEEAPVEPEPQPEEEPIPEPPAPVKQELEPEAEPVDETPKTFSWAGIARKNTPGSQQVAAAPQPAKPAPIKPADVRNDTGPGGSAPLPQRSQRPPARENRDNRGRPRDRDGDADSDGGRRGIRYPDNQQLFVGNLPISITEDELATLRSQIKKHFETYGEVLELRINRKTGGDKVPGFGFVVFKEPGPVQRILGEKPIMFQGHRLNVEEKKQRSETGGRPGSGTRSGRGGSLGPRGPGGPGGPRGGGFSGPRR
ncbi:unnamed protein product [Owenia fusiformis]|uniref:Uncharacterized protein n=1 Tax=Owenia fusiformis TaxID=6347 RepID=A0A8S4PPA2_OWEFU|nr:unnamed protein product [Owenia fusiformis]